MAIKTNTARALPKYFGYGIVKFNKTYKILHAVRGELSWTHYRQLIYIDILEERSFYEQQSILHSWSSRELKKQI